MTDTGTDAERGMQGFPHGIGGADDVVSMPLQCSTQWDGLGHIFDHGMAYNGRRAGDVVTSAGDAVTGIETAAALIAGRGVLLDVGRAVGDGELPDGFAITAGAPRRHRRRARRDRRARRHRAACAPGSSPARGARAGATTRAGRRPGCRSPPPTGCTAREIAAIATDTWGFEVRPNEFDDAFQPLHQVVIPHIGLFIGEMWDLDALAADCATDGGYDVLPDRRPHPVHRRRRGPGQSHRREVRSVTCPLSIRRRDRRRNRRPRPPPSCSPRRASPSTSSRSSPTSRRSVPGSRCRATRCGCCAASACGTGSRLGYAFDALGLRTPDGTLLAEIPDARTGGPDLPATVGMSRPDLARMLVDRAAELGVKIRFGTTRPRSTRTTTASS